MFKVFIDNGHEPGNVNGGTQGYSEWRTNLVIARALDLLLRKHSNITTLVTYDWNRIASVRERGSKAGAWGADILMSIHSNAGGGAGSECYYSVDIPGDKGYAGAISSRIASTFGITDRGARVKYSQTTAGEDYIGVIDSAQDAGVDHVLLVESMFHDNLAEERILLRPDAPAKIARILYEVLCSILKISPIAVVVPAPQPVVPPATAPAGGDDNMIKSTGSFNMPAGTKLVNYKTGAVVKTFAEAGVFAYNYIDIGIDGRLYAVTEYSKSNNITNGVFLSVITQEDGSQYKAEIATLKSLNTSLLAKVAKIKELATAMMGAV